MEELTEDKEIRKLEFAVGMNTGISLAGLVTLAIGLMVNITTGNGHIQEVTVKMMFVGFSVGLLGWLAAGVMRGNLGKLHEERRETGLKR